MLGDGEGEEPRDGDNGAVLVHQVYHGVGEDDEVVVQQGEGGHHRHQGEEGSHHQQHKGTSRRGASVWVQRGTNQEMCAEV